MFNERILNKKFNEINELKGKLVSRSDDSKEDIIKGIKSAIEDIEVILIDFGYIEPMDSCREDEPDNENVDIELSNVENNDEMISDDVRSVRNYTLEEVAKYNGENGNPAYVVINGTVYDVTGNAYWKNGQHFGIRAGSEVTESFYSSHMKDKDILNKLRVVGVIKE